MVDDRTTRVPQLRQIELGFPWFFDFEVALSIRKLDLGDCTTNCRGATEHCNLLIRDKRYREKGFFDPRLASHGSEFVQSLVAGQPKPLRVCEMLQMELHNALQLKPDQFQSFDGRQNELTGIAGFRLVQPPLRRSGRQNHSCALAQAPKFLPMLRYSPGETNIAERKDLVKWKNSYN